MRSKRRARLRVGSRRAPATRSSRRRGGRTRRRSRASAWPSQSGSPRQRQNAGRSEMRSGSTIDAGCRAASPRSRSSITSESTSRPPRDREVVDDRVAPRRRLRAPGAARGRSCAPDDAPPGRRARASRAAASGAAPRRRASSCSCGARARRPARHRWRASFRSTSATTPISASVPPPGAAVAVEQLVGARRAPAPGGVVRGRSAGLVPTRPRSHPRASTALRPRPRA